MHFLCDNCVAVLQMTIFYVTVWVEKSADHGSLRKVCNSLAYMVTRASCGTSDVQADC